MAGNGTLSPVQLDCRQEQAATLKRCPHGTGVTAPDGLTDPELRPFSRQAGRKSANTPVCVPGLAVVLFRTMKENDPK
jgi:hypothetical protein